MSAPMKIVLSTSEFHNILAQFQSAIDSGEYKDRIPYDTWRKLKKIRGTIQIEYSSPFVRISYLAATSSGGDPVESLLYSAKTYDWGFGRFFYDYIVKERDNMSKVSTLASSCSTSTATIAGDSVKTTVDIDWASKIADCTADKAISTVDYGVTNIGTAYPSYDYDLNGTWCQIGDTKADKVEFDRLEAKVNKVLNDLTNKNKCVEKENDTMMKGIHFDFGPCGNTVRLSMYGMAIQNIAGEWVSYNPDSREIINVDVFNMPDGGKYMYKMPVAIADVKVGDIVVHNKVPMFVTAINENGTFEVTDVRAGETKSIIPTRNMFGFNFMTKVVSLFGAFTDAPTADQPFGNMLPFLMMSGDNKDIDPMLMFMMMGQGGTNIMGNPMMLYFMMKDNKDFDPMMLMFMMNQNHACTCGGKHEAPATV